MGRSQNDAHQDSIFFRIMVIPPPKTRFPETRPLIKPYRRGIPGADLQIEPSGSSRLRPKGRLRKQRRSQALATPPPRNDYRFQLRLPTIRSGQHPDDRESCDLTAGLRYQRQPP